MKHTAIQIISTYFTSRSSFAPEVELQRWQATSQVSKGLGKSGG